MAGRERVTPRIEPGISTVRRWGEYLIAVLAGNIIYLFIEPQLPIVMRHRMFRVDIGLGIDFLICVGVYGLIRMIRGRNPGGSRSDETP